MRGWAKYGIGRLRTGKRQAQTQRARARNGGHRIALGKYTAELVMHIAREVLLVLFGHVCELAVLASIDGDRLDDDLVIMVPVHDHLVAERCPAGTVARIRSQLRR
ncbi:conserved hypothetical protein [Ricinus communis]|uniref:Uncharacterized protein n=1 Tax=Ricinus communis TaxID=3988 RepID=B9TAV2_RICCO|nr:conserved hypothetical protein [Ricinus communis]